MHVEPDFEAALERLIPGCSSHWIGATSEEIDELERFARRPLPLFYRWFLFRMGRSVGPLENPRRDMRIQSILSIYRDGFMHSQPSLLLIASETDDIMPMYMYYDLDVRVREDARVCSCEQGGGPLQVEFETLRECMAWNVFGPARLRGRLRCQGKLRDPGREIITKINPVLLRLGFDILHHTGPRCGLYDRADVAIRCSVPAGGEIPTYMFFTAAGDELEIRHTLGVIATETSVDVEINKWNPAPS